MTAPLTHDEELARLATRLGELRGRALRAPLTAAQLQQLARTAAELAKMIPQLTRYVAALEHSRGLALESQRALLTRVTALELDAAMVVVTELRRAGQIRAAVRAYVTLVVRAPRDDRFADRLAGLSHLLEEYAINPAAGITRSLARSLHPGWWSNPFNHELVDQTFGELRIDWSRLP